MLELMTTGVLVGVLSIVVVDWISNNPIVAAILAALLALFFFFYLLLRRAVVEFKQGMKGNRK